LSVIQRYLHASLSALFQVGGPRSVQLALRFSF